LLTKGFKGRTSRKFRCAHGNLLSSAPVTR
jgi:hypothetical protein